MQRQGLETQCGLLGLADAHLIEKYGKVKAKGFAKVALAEIETRKSERTAAALIRELEHVCSPHKQVDIVSFAMDAPICRPLYPRMKSQYRGGAADRAAEAQLTGRFLNSKHGLKGELLTSDAPHELRVHL